MKNKSFQQIPLGFVITLGLIILIEVGIALWPQPSKIQAVMSHRFYTGESLPSVDESIVQWQTAFLFQRQGHYFDVLFLGDSSCLMGIDPWTFVGATKKMALNLGTLGWMSPEGHADLLQIYLDQLKPPKIIVYHVTPRSLTNLAKEIEDAGFLRRFRLWQSSLGLRQSDLRSRLMPWTWLPSYRWRGRIWTFIDHGSYEKWVHEPRGAYMSDDQMREFLWNSNGMLRELNQWSPKPRTDPMATDVTPQAIEGIRRISALAHRYGIKLVFTFGPVPEQWNEPQLTEAYRLMSASINRQLSDAFDGFCPVRFYPNSCFGSPNHLTPLCAAQNTTDIAHQLDLK